MLDRALHRVSQSRTLGGFIALLERIDRRQPNLLRVLTYHRVDVPTAHPELDPGLISATPSMFQYQVEYVANHYRPVSVAQVLDAVRGGELLPPRSVLFTFDDAYCDFAQNAWPILRSYGVPAALFVPTGFPDRPDQSFWWDRLHQAVRFGNGESIESPIGRLSTATPFDRNASYEKLKRYIKSLPHDDAMRCVERLAAVALRSARPHVLGWRQLRELAGQGVSMGAHTRTHPLLNRITAERAALEATQSLLDLQQHVGPVLPIFAYPGGEFDDGVVQRLASAGFELAFTTRRGINDLGRSHPLQLRRINIGARTNQSVLRAQLLPWCNAFAPLL